MVNYLIKYILRVLFSLLSYNKGVDVGERGDLTKRDGRTVRWENGCGGRLGECKDKRVVIIEKNKWFHDSDVLSYLYRFSCSWTGKNAVAEALSPTEGALTSTFNFYQKTVSLSPFLRSSLWES